MACENDITIAISTIGHNVTLRRNNIPNIENASRTNRLNGRVIDWKTCLDNHEEYLVTSNDWTELFSIQCGDLLIKLPR